MSVTRSLGALAIVVALGAAGFFLGREFLSDGDTHAGDSSTLEQLDALKTEEARRTSEPRFVGERLGIHFAPSLEQLDSRVREENERLTAGGCEVMNPQQAGALDFDSAVAMPDGYVLADPGVEGSNPWADACSGKPYLLGWRYATTRADGIPATIIVVRSVLRFDTQDVAESQVSTETIGGRDAVIIRPLLASGLGQRTLIYFPEPFGQTAIHAFNISEADVLRVAEAVAAASR